MRRKVLLSGLILVVALFVILVAGLVANSRFRQLQKASSSLNLLIISVDTFRPDRMSVYGYQKPTTPYLEKFAKDSFVFNNAYTVVPMTYPSFAALFTGLSPLRSRITTHFVVRPNKNDVYYQKGFLSEEMTSTPTEGQMALVDGALVQPVSENTPTVMKVLNNHGYKTATFITNGALSQELSQLQFGVDEYYRLKEFLSIDLIREDYNRLINQSVDWLGKNKDQHFFTWIHLMEPHYPYLSAADKKERCRFSPELCETLNAQTNQELNKIWQDSRGCKTGPIKTGDQAVLDALYDSSVYTADRQIERILEALKKNDLDKKTIVVIYGDHGDGEDHDFYFDHGPSLYQSSIKIPLIIKDPLIKPNAATEKQLVLNTDIFPTLLDLLNIREPNLNIDGVSFSEVFYRNFQPQFNSNLRQEGIITNKMLDKFVYLKGDYKYLYSNNISCTYKEQKDELYDLSQDGQENNNLMVEEERLATKMKNKLFNYLGGFNLPQKNVPNVIKLDEKRAQILDNLRSLGY